MVPAAQQGVRREKDKPEDRNREGAGGGEADSGESKESGFEQRPDRERGSGVEVSGNVPLAALKVADGSIAVPALVGIFGPIHPGRVVGEIGVEMDGVQSEEDSCNEEDKGLNGLDDARRNDVRPFHGP